MTESNYPLWSDEPTVRDLLSFEAVAATVVDAILDDKLDPIALGLSGSWGSGKTSVLELVRAAIEKQAIADETRVIVIPTQPWSYDPAVGPKESLIAEVLAALSGELKLDAGDNARNLLNKLVGRVNWAKAFKIAAKAGIAFQLPSVDDILGLIKEDPKNEDSPERGLAGFREDFESLLKLDGLKHISRVVVLVDDLDRCLPETVVETLEAIRLFLSAKGMSFVIAADEDRVAEAIQQRFGNPKFTEDASESPATLYLHKIVQTTIPLPALSRFDTNAYLFLLLVERRVSSEVFDKFVSSCNELRTVGGSLDDLEISENADVAIQLAVASRLTPMLYEKFRGNPRRIKRFLNDLNVRQSVAKRRGIELSSDAVAKLMMLERLLPEDFEVVLEWLATNQLRDQLEALERFANEPDSPPAEPGETDASMRAPTKQKVASAEASLPIFPESSFSDTLQRWAKLPPRLDATAVAGYLYLAASFTGKELVSNGLPERLRDIAISLISTSKIDRDGITDDALKAISAGDARILISHLGSLTRDQPTIQKHSVLGMLRLVKTHPGIEDAIVVALKLLPAVEVQVVSVILLKPESGDIYRPVLQSWDANGASPQVKTAIKSVFESWSGINGN